MATTPSAEPPDTSVRRSVRAIRPHIDGSVGDLCRTGALAVRANNAGYRHHSNEGACTDAEPVSTAGNGMFSAVASTGGACIHAASRALSTVCGLRSQLLRLPRVLSMHTTAQ